MELKDIQNPYYYDRPADKSTFVGREEHLKDIEYYLNDGINAENNRCRHLAITGDRAMGKTSLLGRLREEAAEKGCCTVKIELDDSSVEDEPTFLFTIFDNVLSEACELGAYEGTGGRTYETYRDVMAGITPEDRTFMPFMFPSAYFRFAQAGGLARLPNNLQVFTRDLEHIRDRCKEKGITLPIVVTIDECDVLAEQRSCFQQLRNLVQHLDGYMFAIAGTGKLLEGMDDVYSPVSRQFTKIQLGPFTEEKDTLDSIRKPLVNLEARFAGQSGDVMDQQRLAMTVSQLIHSLEASRMVEEVHKWTTGRPYDIRLLSQVMFKRLQDGSATTMELSSQCMDDARAQMTGDDSRLKDSPLVPAVQTLNADAMAMMTSLYAFNDSVTLEQFFAVQKMKEVFGVSYQGTILGDITADWQGSWDECSSICDRLISSGILSRDGDGLLVFNGEEREWIYLRYWSYDIESPIPHSRWSHRQHLLMILWNSLRKTSSSAPEGFALRTPLSTHISSILDAIYDPGFDAKGEPQSIDQREFEVAYGEIVSLNPCNLCYGRAELITLWATISAPIIVGDVDGASKLQDIFHDSVSFGHMASIDSNHSLGEINISEESRYTIENRDRFIDRILWLCGEVPVNLAFASRIHTSQGEDSHREGDDLLAEWHMRAADTFSRSMQSINNLGYMLISTGDIRKAIDIFLESGCGHTGSDVTPEQHQWREDDPGLYALLRYNLSVAYALEDEIRASVDILDSLLDDPAQFDHSSALCVFEPLIVEGKIQKMEIYPEEGEKPIDLRTIADQARETLQTYITLHRLAGSFDNIGWIDRDRQGRLPLSGEDVFDIDG